MTHGWGVVLVSLKRLCLLLGKATERKEHRCLLTQGGYTCQAHVYGV